MDNSTSITMFQMLQNKTDTELINLIQSSFSLGCTLCIFYRVFDFSSYFKSVKEKREINRKKAQKKEYDRMRKLFEAMKNDELDQVSLSTDDEQKVEEEEEDADAGVFIEARKAEGNPVKLKEITRESCRKIRNYDAYPSTITISETEVEVNTTEDA